MKKNVLFSLVVLCITIAFLGCGARCPDAAHPSLRLGGFDSTELSVVVLKKYNALNIPIEVDTINANTYYTFYGYELGLTNDWLIEVPLANKTYQLTNIKYQKEYSGGERCTEYIRYKVNSKEYYYPLIMIEKNY